MKAMQPDASKIYPRTNDSTICYLKNIITTPNIIVGDFTFYNDYVHDPKDFEKNNVLYHYPYVNHDRLIIGKFCSIACGAKFLFNSANHTVFCNGKVQQNALQKCNTPRGLLSCRIFHK